MDAVMISIRPHWCKKIESGEKTIEVRKTRPRLETPFKCYIYCTKAKNDYDRFILRGGDDMPFDVGNETVIGEFVCDRIQKTFDPAGGLVDVVDCETSRLTPREIIRYADGKALYFWHISDLLIYDKPKELSMFLVEGNQAYDYPQLTPLKRPPQSWCYVEGMN